MTKSGGEQNSIIAVISSDGETAAPARTSQLRAGARFDVPDARAWLTAVDASALGLPACPSERTFQNAIRDGVIATRKRAARGGGREFHWTSLPREAAAEYLKRYGVAAIENSRAGDAKSRANQRDLLAEARHAIVKEVQSYIADHHMTVGKGLNSFCKAFERRRTKLDPWIYNIVPAIAVHQLRTWERLSRNEGAGALIDRRGRPSGSGLVESDDMLRQFIVSQLAARPQLTAAQIRDIVATDLKREIALRTLQAFLSRFRKDNAPILKALTNPDQFRSHHKPAFGSQSINITRINQRWEVDATRADAMCLMPDGSRRRQAITALVDVFTRRAMVLVSDQPRSLATQALLRRAILAWGMPELLKADNGKEFVARSMTRFCGDLGIEISFSRPFTPEQKPHVERFFGTLNRGLFKMLPGFVGHNIAERKAIDARASFAHRFGEVAELVFETSLTPEGLQARADRWLADIYEHEIHSGIGRTPAEMALAFGDQVKRVGDERALDALLLDAPDASGIRNVVKKGVRVAGRWYIAGELGAVMGHRVHVRLDPADLGRIVVYTHDRARFICIAENSETIDNARRMEIARAAQAVQRNGLRLIRNEVRDIQRQFPAAGVADRILNAAAGDGFVLADDASEAMETAARPRLIAMRAGLDALDEAKQASKPIAPTEEQRAVADEMIADMTARQTQSPRLVQCDGYQRPYFESDLDFWAWAQAHRAQGLVLDAADTAQLAELSESRAFQFQLIARACATNT